MDKTYDPHQAEKRWYGRWEREGYFVPRDGADPYCIMIPPPNVTGTLHMGHAFQDTIMDALIRYKRMMGRSRHSLAARDGSRRNCNADGGRAPVQRWRGRHPASNSDANEFVDRSVEMEGAESGGKIANQLQAHGGLTGLGPRGLLHHGR